MESGVDAEHYTPCKYQGPQSTTTAELRIKLMLSDTMHEIGLSCTIDLTNKHVNSRRKWIAEVAGLRQIKMQCSQSNAYLDFPTDCSCSFLPWCFLSFLEISQTYGNVHQQNSQIAYLPTYLIISMYQNSLSVT